MVGIGAEKRDAVRQQKEPAALIRAASAPARIFGKALEQPDEPQQQAEGQIPAHQRQRLRADASDGVGLSG